MNYLIVLRRKCLLMSTNFIAHSLLLLYKAASILLGKVTCSIILRSCRKDYLNYLRSITSYLVSRLTLGGKSTKDVTPYASVNLLSEVLHYLSVLFRLSKTLCINCLFPLILKIILLLPYLFFV